MVNMQGVKWSYIHFGILNSTSRVPRLARDKLWGVRNTAVNQ